MLFDSIPEKVSIKVPDTRNAKRNIPKVNEIVDTEESRISSIPTRKIS